MSSCCPSEQKPELESGAEAKTSSSATKHTQPDYLLRGSSIGIIVLYSFNLSFLTSSVSLSWFWGYVKNYV